jgi:exosortase/archaeosortase family protein
MKVKLDKNQKKLFETLLFLVKLLVFAIPLYIIMSFQGVLSPLQEIVTQNIQSILQFLGFNVSRDAFLITANDVAFFISEDCTGWKSMLLLAALVFAVPKVRMKKRVIGVALGIPAIYIGNLARILAVVLAWHNYGFEFASAIHDYFWQAGLISLVLALWVSWLAWTGKISFKKKKMLIRRRHKLIKPKERKKISGKTRPERLKRVKPKSR